MTLTAFDPAHAGATGALSSGNRIYTPTDLQNGARVTNGYDAGGGLKLWWEFLCVTPSAFGANFPVVGLSPSGDTFNGNGINGYAATMIGGYAVFDNATGTYLQAHGGALPGIAHTANFGAGTAGSSIGLLWDTAAGTLDVYAIDGAGNKVICCTITGIPTTGVFYPTYGTGQTGTVRSEAYQINTRSADFRALTLPAGATAYEDAVNPAPVVTATGAGFFALL